MTGEKKVLVIYIILDKTLRFLKGQNTQLFVWIILNNLKKILINHMNLNKCSSYGSFALRCRKIFIFLHCTFQQVGKI